MPKKPANLMYGVDDRPPLPVILILAVQHVLFMTSGFIVVTIVMNTIGCPPFLTRQVVSMSMIAAGAATMLQALRRGPVGSGYLCAEGTDPSFISVSILAGTTGGISLVFGMTLVAGVIECLLARVMHRLRILFPPEVTGVVLTMVGLNVVPIVILDFYGVTDMNRMIEPVNVCVALITLGVMVGTNVWSRGRLRLYSVIIGMLAGYAAAVLLGVFGEDDVRSLAQAPLFAIPDVSHIGWSFDLRLLIPFVVVTLASTLKSVATLTMCQKINDADWKRPDLGNIGRGTLADGLASVLGGLCGALGKSLYASSVGLCVATGATSRIIAFYVGRISIVLAFFPKIAAFFSVMPRPVMGGALIFMVCFMVISGIQMMASRMIDVRKTFIIAVSLIFGLSVDIFPELYRHVHPFLQPLFSSSLAVTTLLAIALNLILRIGVGRKARLELTPGVDFSEKIFDFLDARGAAWGARPEVIRKAERALNEFVEMAAMGDGVRGAVRVEVEFDEFNLDLRIAYNGPAVEFPTQRPDMATFLTDPETARRFKAYLVRQFADRVSVKQEGETCTVALHFDH